MIDLQQIFQKDMDEPLRRGHRNLTENCVILGCEINPRPMPAIFQPWIANKSIRYPQSM